MTTLIAILAIICLYTVCVLFCMAISFKRMMKIGLKKTGDAGYVYKFVGIWVALLLFWVVQSLLLMPLLWEKKL